MTTWFSLDEITQGIDGCLVRMMTCMSSTGIQTVVSFNDDTSGTVSGMGNVSIDLNCNDDSEWTYMRNGVTEVITTISCLTA
ncbi:unnamed protein product, partial [Mesorhabditis belari]|uniref:C6 domain-containing protein n=1 Tax=Mesorhabditis belari TaxID=2138241 RepID=A0AAF3EC91_9BILA